MLQLVLRLGFRHDQAGHERRAMIAASPMAADTSATANMRMNAGTSGVSAKQRPGEDLSPQPARAPRGREPERDQSDRSDRHEQRRS